LAERKGVTVERVERADLPAFYELLVETARRDGFLIRGRSYFEDLFDCLEPSGLIAMFLARFEEKPIAGAVCMGFGPRLTYVYRAWQWGAPLAIETLKRLKRGRIAAADD